MMCVCRRPSCIIRVPPSSASTRWTPPCKRSPHALGGQSGSGNRIPRPVRGVVRRLRTGCSNRFAGLRTPGIRDSPPRDRRSLADDMSAVADVLSQLATVWSELAEEPAAFAEEPPLLADIEARFAQVRATFAQIAPRRAEAETRGRSRCGEVRSGPSLAR